MPRCERRPHTPQPTHALSLPPLTTQKPGRRVEARGWTGSLGPHRGVGAGAATSHLCLPVPAPLSNPFAASQGRNAQHHAAENGQVEVFRALLDRDGGAALDAKEVMVRGSLVGRCMRLV
jgi:hypothetical protein